MWAKSPRDPLLGELEHHLLGAVDEIGRLAGPVLAESLDLLADPDEAAQRRHLLDDLGVVLRVRRRRDEGSELRDLRRTPTRSSSLRSSSWSASVIASTGSPLPYRSSAAR